MKMNFHFKRCSPRPRTKIDRRGACTATLGQGDVSTALNMTAEGMVTLGQGDPSTALRMTAEGMRTLGQGDPSTVLRMTAEGMVTLGQGDVSTALNMTVKKEGQSPQSADIRRTAPRIGVPAK